MKAVLGLVHPAPSAATVLVAGGFAALLTGGAPRLGRLGQLVTMVGLQQAAISLHNDWCDQDLDAITKPWRAIPAGHVRASQVHALAWGAAAASAAAAVPLGRDAVALDIVGTAAGFSYNAWLKRTRWSWLPFAVAFPLLPLYGAAAVDHWPQGWWMVFIVGAPAVLAVHLADTLPDLAGDAAAGVGGLPHRLGAERARRAALVALAAEVVLDAACGVVMGSGRAAAGAVSGLVGALVATHWPATHRHAVTAGAVAAALGWVAALAHAGRA